MTRSGKLLLASMSASITLSFAPTIVGADTIVGPTSWTVAGASDTFWGIQFTALVDSTLTSFDFNHKENNNPMNGDTGLTGTVELIDITQSNAVLLSESYGTFPSPPLIPFTGLGIALTSGDQYQLLDVPTSNPGNDEVYQYNMLNNPTLSFPDSDAEISVTQGVFNDPNNAANTAYLESTSWAAFNNITTTNVPEPGVYSLFASLGLTGALLLRRKHAR